MGSVHLRAIRNGLVAAVLTAAAGFALNGLFGAGGPPVAAGSTVSPPPSPSPSGPSGSSRTCKPQVELLERATVGGLIGRLEDVWLDGPADGWAVGWSGAHDGDASAVVARWDGSAWSESSDVRHTSRVEVLLGVDGSDADDVWAVGWSSDGVGTEPLAVRYDGSSWDVTDASHDAALFDVRSLAPDDAWAVGSAGDPEIVNERAIALHWDGARWAQAAVPVGGGRSGLYAIAGTDDDLWAVGYHHRGPLILRYDGGTWERGPDIDARGPLDAVAVAGDTVWVAGSSVARGDGAGFEEIAKARHGGRFSALAATAPDGAFAVGSVVAGDATRALAVEVADGRATAARVRASGDDALEAIALIGGEGWAVGWHETGKGVLPLVATLRGC